MVFSWCKLSGCTCIVERGTGLFARIGACKRAHGLSTVHLLGSASGDRDCRIFLQRQSWTCHCSCYSFGIPCYLWDCIFHSPAGFGCQVGSHNVGTHLSVVTHFRMVGDVVHSFSLCMLPCFGCFCVSRTIFCLAVAKTCFLHYGVTTLSHCYPESVQTLP